MTLYFIESALRAHDFKTTEGLRYWIALEKTAVYAIWTLYKYKDNTPFLDIMEFYGG